jgi:hypothetical protein
MKKLTISLQRTVEIKRGDEVTTFTMYPLPLGYHAYLERVYPSPVEYVGNGVKNEARPVQNALYEHNYLSMLCMIAKSLRDQVEAQPPTSEKRADWDAYAKALKAEYSEAGLIEGDLMALRKGMEQVNQGIMGKGEPPSA